MRRRMPGVMSPGGLCGTVACVMICLLSGKPTQSTGLLNAAAAEQSFEVTEATIAGTQSAIRDGQATCRMIDEAYLARIVAYDQPTRLNSIVTINPDLLADADQSDRQFARTHKLLPLSGIAVMVKDNYDTRGLQTTGRSLVMKGFRPDKDATIVARLRAAGALVLAKSNMAEWAFSPYVTASPIAGITRDPYDLSRVPAGSSGGAAAAMSASLGEVGLGTDKGNSIRSASSYNDLVGIRPTIGLTSREGITPLFSGNDVGGPVARTVADAAAELTVIAGYDAADSMTELSRAHPAVDYPKSLDPKGLRGARIGVFRQYFETPTTDAQVRATTERALDELRAQGTVLVDPFTVPDYARFTRDLWCGDFRADLDGYLAEHPGALYHNLQSIVDSGLYLPYTEQQMRDAVHPKSSPGERTGACPDVYHDKQKILFRQAFLAAIDLSRLDAIVYPTWSNPPRKVGDMKSPAGDNSQVLSPQAGFPAITVPMGFTYDHLPAGLTFLGRAFSESELIRLAYSYEQATDHRVARTFFPPLTKGVN